MKSQIVAAVAERCRGYVVAFASEKGYEIWAAELQPYLKKYVGK